MVSGKHLANFPVSLMVSCPFKCIPSPRHVSMLVALHHYTTFGMAS
jgi:hypothetical protein